MRHTDKVQATRWVEVVRSAKGQETGSLTRCYVCDHCVRLKSSVGTLVSDGESHIWN